MLLSFGNTLLSVLNLKSFDETWSWHDALMQVAEKWTGSGQTVIVTGCSGGLGLESVRVLAARGAHVIM